MVIKRKAEASPEVSRRSTRLQTVKKLSLAAEVTLGTPMASSKDVNPDLAPPSATQKPKRSRRPRQRKSCSFLSKLPGEIKNMIYRYVLVQPSILEITPKGPGEPTLLRVCNRVRCEARSIYYAENSFKLKLQDYNGTDFDPFKDQYLSLYNWQGKGAVARRGMNFTVEMGGSPNWENLMSWIKADRYRTALWPDLGGGCCPSHQLITSAFNIAFATRSLSWETARSALDAMRDVLDGLPSSWAKYPDYDF